MIKERYSMFEPKSQRRLSTDYPELKENPYIADLQSRDQKFCWYLGCEVSPVFADYHDKDKRDEVVEYAISKCYGPADGKKIKDIKKKMPANLLKGIEAFEKYNVSVRVRSKKLLSKIADNFEKIIDVDVDGPEFYEVDKDGGPTGEVDFDKKAKYVTMAIAVSKNIGEIINQAESGYSVTLVEEEEDKVLSGGINAIDFFHESEK